MPRISKTATALLTILNNINDLIVVASNREGARDVMKALVVYAKNKGFPLPQDKVADFETVLLDCKPFTLTSIIKDIAEDIILVDYSKKW